MLEAPIFFILVSIVVSVLAGHLLSNDEEVFGGILIIIALGCIAVSTIILVENVQIDTDEQVKSKVLQHLTYTNDVTLVPKNDGTFFYELNNQKFNDLFTYITTDRNNEHREVE